MLDTKLDREYIIVDVEADGPAPTLGSMVCFGAVSVNRLSEHKNVSFYGLTAPLTTADLSIRGRTDEYIRWEEKNLAISGYTRAEHESFQHSQLTMIQFKSWLTTLFDRPVFVSDNPAFDWQFINFYFHLYGLGNPFGFSARRIGDFYSGLNRDWSDHNSWKKLRKTTHTHNPVDDAKGNAEALLALLQEA